MNAPVRLLIADDSELVRKAIKTILKDESSVTVIGEASDYAAMLKMLAESAPQVVLMDLRMPDENRYEAADIKAQLRGCHLLAMSIWDDRQTVNRAISLGALKLLEKSNLASTLVPAIQECTRQN
jgi:DNA-binding NarL/FixJ family response regulator